MHIMQSRRDLLTSASLAAGASFLGTRASVADEAPPETTTIRLATVSNICIAPTYIAGELLRAEGFTDVLVRAQGPLRRASARDVGVSDSHIIPGTTTRSATSRDATMAALRRQRKSRAPQRGSAAPCVRVRWDSSGVSGRKHRARTGARGRGALRLSLHAASFVPA
jgi:hypothetical protein